MPHSAVLSAGGAAAAADRQATPCTRRYASALADVAGVGLLAECVGTHSNYWLQTLLLEPAYSLQRLDSILALCNQQGIATRPVWALNHRLPAFRDSPRMSLSIAESLEQRIINLPSSAQLALRPTGPAER